MKHHAHPTTAAPPACPRVVSPPAPGPAPRGPPPPPLPPAGGGRGGGGGESLGRLLHCRKVSSGSGARGIQNKNRTFPCLRESPAAFQTCLWLRFLCGQALQR